MNFLRKLGMMLTILCVCFSAIGSPVQETPEGLETKLHGLWAEIYLDNGEILSYVYYLPEGRFHAFGYLEEAKNEFWFSYGLWRMNGDQSCITFLFDTYGLMRDAGESCVSVLSVTEDTFIYKDNDDGSVQTLKRVSDGYLP